EDAIFRQQLPAGGEGVELAVHDGIGGVPVEAEAGDGGEQAHGLLRGGGVAVLLVLEYEGDALFAGGLHGGAVRLGIFEAPEIEAADLVGLKLFGEGDARGEDVVLLVKAGGGEVLGG